MHHGQSHSRDLFWSLAGLALAVTLTVITLNRYVGDADEAYQILNAQDWQAVPFASLSSFIGHMWGSTFGFGWLQMRVLSMILNLAAIAAGGYACFRILRDAPRAIWFTAATVALYALTNDHEQKYDWDSFTTFSLACVAVMTMCYARRPRRWLIAAVGAAASVAVMMRLPSLPVLFVPPIVVIFYDTVAPGRRTADLCAYAAAAALTALMLVTAMYGTPGGLLGALHDNAIENHSARVILSAVFQSLKIMIYYIVLLSGATFVVFMTRNLKPAAAAMRDAVLFVLLAAGAWWINSRSLLFDYPYMGFTLFTLLLCVLLGRKRLFGGMSGGAIIMLLCSLAAVSGSNCAFNRMIVYAFAPVLMAYVATDWPRWARRAGAVGFVAFTAAMLTMPQTNIRVFLSSAEPGKYHRVDAQKAHGVYFDEDYARWIEEMMPVIEKYKGLSHGRVTVMSEYSDGFIIEYLTDTPNPVTRHIWGSRDKRMPQPQVTDSVIALSMDSGAGAVILIALSPALDNASRDFSPFDAACSLVEEGEHYRVYAPGDGNTGTRGEGIGTRE